MLCAAHWQNAVIVKSKSHLESLTLQQLYTLIKKSSRKDFRLFSRFGFEIISYIKPVDVSGFTCLNFSNGSFLYGLGNTLIQLFNGDIKSFDHVEIKSEVTRKNFLVSKDYIEETATFYKLGLKNGNQQFLVNNNFIIKL